MPIIVSARLKAGCKHTQYLTDDDGIRRGDHVIVDAEIGQEVAVVLSVKPDAPDPEYPIKKVLRKLTREDKARLDDNARLETEGRQFCHERIAARNLPMRLSGTSVSFDRKKFIFYFTAEKRVDFRELVKDLASKFKTRIELRQIGIRDESKLIGGLGSCGREVCCKLFLSHFEPVSIRMAKGQDLALNPNKISGLCGRLMCCLSYEFEGRRKPGKALRAPGTRSACIDEQQDETTQEESATALAAPAAENRPSAEAIAHELPESSQTPEIPETEAAQESGASPDSVKNDSAKKDKRRYFIRRGKFGKRKPKDSAPQ